MTDDVKARLLSEVGADAAAALEHLPGHFFATAAAIAESTDREAVLGALWDLLAANTAQLRRRADAAETQIATLRRSHLALVPSPTAGAPRKEHHV